MNRFVVGLLPALLTLTAPGCDPNEEALTATASSTSTSTSTSSSGASASETSAGSMGSTSGSSGETSSGPPGSTSGSSGETTASDLGCPAEPPNYFDTVFPGDSCDVDGGVCIYDDDPQCPEIHRCTDGAWEWEFWPRAGETCTTPGRVCEYLTLADACGEKAWTVCSADATVSVELFPRASDCPDEVPEGDSPCEAIRACEDAVSGVMGCLYHVDTECGVLEAQAECAEGTWEVELPVCRP